MVQTFNEWMSLKESNLWERHGEKLPSIFRRTYYALPTDEQLEEFQQYPDLTADEILDGFSYTIVGRGMDSPKNKQMIVDSIQMLSDRYPQKQTYKEALKMAKEKQKQKSSWG